MEHPLPNLAGMLIMTGISHFYRYGVSLGLKNMMRNTKVVCGKEM